MSEPLPILDGGKRGAATGDTVRPRRPAGLCPGWGPLRTRAARRILSGAASRAPLAGTAPGHPHLSAAAAAMAEQSGHPDLPVVLAALDMLDGTVADLPGREARRSALALAAAAAALAGRQAHLACLSEGCAERLHQVAAPLLAALGRSCALLPDAAGIDERQAAHRADVVIASAARLAQDMLRDHELMGGAARGFRARVRRLAERTGSGALFRGAPMAFVDDADLVMVEAPRPVGFAADPEDDANRLRAEEAFVVLHGLAPGTHYLVDPVTRRIRLTEAGEARLELAAALFEGPWQRRRWREETILAALTVRDFFRAGDDYRIEQSEVVLAREPTSAVEPGIAALVAAKERLGPAARLARLWNCRRFLSGYDHLAGIGYATSALARDLGSAYGLRVRGRVAGPPPPPPEFRSPAERPDLLAQMRAGAVLWAPTAEDARSLGPRQSEAVVGEAVFAMHGPSLIVQVAAAQESWERRLRDVHPSAEIHALASAEDGLFGILDSGNPALAAFRARPSPARYRAAQAVRAAAAAERRAAHLASDRYFERVLAFAGDGP